LRGVCILDSGESVPSAIDAFKKSLNKPESYIMLGICEKKLGNKAASM
jgi:hypothetical protein